MATSASEAHNQTNDQATRPAPRPMAARGSMCASAITSRNVHDTTPAQTPPTTAHLSSALPSSEAPRSPNSRFNPASGLRREKSGAMARTLKFQPPSSSDASSTKPTRAANTGSRTLSALMQASPSAVIIPSGSRSVCASMARPLRIICDNRVASDPPTAISVALPPIMVAKFVSSRERGNWPRSRASCRRFCDGSSVRSPPVSASAAISAPPRAGARGRRRRQARC
jgi:hypothetical protein